MIFFYLIYLAESYSTYNKNIVRTYTYIYNNNKYHMYILSKKPRITQKVVKQWSAKSGRWPVGRGEVKTLVVVSSVTWSVQW